MKLPLGEAAPMKLPLCCCFGEVKLPTELQWGDPTKLCPLEAGEGRGPPLGSGNVGGGLSPNAELDGDRPADDGLLAIPSEILGSGMVNDRVDPRGCC